MGAGHYVSNIPCLPIYNACLALILCLVLCFIYCSYFTIKQHIKKQLWILWQIFTFWWIYVKFTQFMWLKKLLGYIIIDQKKQNLEKIHIICSWCVHLLSQVLNKCRMFKMHAFNFSCKCLYSCYQIMHPLLCNVICCSEVVYIMFVHGCIIYFLFVLPVWVSLGWNQRSGYHPDNLIMTYDRNHRIVLKVHWKQFDWCNM